MSFSTLENRPSTLELTSYGAMSYDVTIIICLAVDAGGAEPPRGGDALAGLHAGVGAAGGRRARASHGRALLRRFPGYLKWRSARLELKP